MNVACRGSRKMACVLVKELCAYINRCVKKPAIKNLRLNSVCAQIDAKTNLAIPSYFIFNEHFKDEGRKCNFVNDMKIIDDFVTDEEEKSLIDEVEPQLKRLRYEKGHWDGAIENYRELEKNKWNEFNASILNRVQKLAFDEGDILLKRVHVLDLRADGVIKPHVDSVKFCGKTIAGLSLLSQSVMRLRLDKNREEFVDILLKRKSLYIMKNSARYDFAHEILGNKESKFGNEIIEKTRRVSVISRCEP